MREAFGPHDVRYGQAMEHLGLFLVTKGDLHGAQQALEVSPAPGMVHGPVFDRFVVSNTLFT
jgi:hypothetical protein